MKLDALITPSEFAALSGRDLRRTACVVFDVLRATSTFVTALHHGAEAVIPVCDIAEALALRQQRPEVLLGGERHGVRISAGGIEFDLGNSPREYSGVRGRIIVSTTTNGTRALRACAAAPTVLATSFLNLTATAEFLLQNDSENILLVCAGTGENAALEDVLGAGALCDLLAGASRAQDRVEPRSFHALSDAAQIAWRTYRESKADLPGAMSSSENARRLLAIPGLRDDVAFCLQQDLYPLVATMDKGGVIRTV